MEFIKSIRCPFKGSNNWKKAQLEITHDKIKLPHLKNFTVQIPNYLSTLKAVSIKSRFKLNRFFLPLLFQRD